MKWFKRYLEEKAAPPKLELDRKTQLLKDRVVKMERQIEAEYLGVKLADDVDIQALLDEITSLRQQLLEAKTIITDYTKNKK